MRTYATLAAACALLAAPALAQIGPNTDQSPAATPAPAAVPDAAPPAERPREAGTVVPIPIWRAGNGELVSIQGNKLSEPERMNAGVPPRPLMPGAIVNTQERMRAGKSPTTLPEGVHPGETAHMSAGPAPRSLPVGQTPADIVAGGGAPMEPVTAGGTQAR